jgi:uncharacterized coiled-coil protein SlyX
MKNFFFLSATSFLLFSCNQKQATVNRVEYDSLVSIINERDESITNFATSFNDVERNLDSITIKQQIISLNSKKSGEFTESQKSRINNEILAINALMSKNKIKLDEITKKFKNSSTKNKALEKTINTINNQLEQKQKELAALNTTLSNLYLKVEVLETSVDYLIRENEVQSDIIGNNISTLHTAFYVVGKSSMLLEAKIIDKKGGLLGIGRTTEINKDINNENFIKIDNTKTTFFPINNKGVKVITSHPPKSYILETDINDKDKVINLVIIEPTLFWSASKYLVVVTK